MGFYDLSKKERIKLVEKITQEITNDLTEGKVDNIQRYFSDDDTYIRKAGYQAVGNIFKATEKLRPSLIMALKRLQKSDIDKVRQTTVNAVGEIGKVDFSVVEFFFDKGLFDQHHSVKNAVIGSIKKMSERNPQPILKWAR